jgi:hypothetical protein
MNKFSIEILPSKIKLYKCTRDEYKNIIDKYNLYNDEDILCKTMIEDEITFYYHIRNDKDNRYIHYILSKICVSDTREYTVINIFEDLPGIDHVGIIYNISRYMAKSLIYRNKDGKYESRIYRDQKGIYEDVPHDKNYNIIREERLKELKEKLLKTTEIPLTSSTRRRRK